MGPPLITSMRAHCIDNAPVSHSSGAVQESTDGETDQNEDEDIENEKSVLSAIGSSTAIGSTTGDSTTIAGTTKVSAGDSIVPDTATAMEAAILDTATSTKNSADGDTTAVSGPATIISAVAIDVDGATTPTTPDKLLADNGRVFFFFQMKLYLQLEIDIAMHSPPRAEGASHAVGGILHGCTAGNTFQFADHSPGAKVDIIGIKKAAVCLYTTTADPTIAHTSGMEGLSFVKAKVPMNVYLHSVLKSLTKLDSSIECKL